MRGRPLRIEWRDSAEELFRRYRREKDLELRTRLHGLWLVRRGHSLRVAAQLVGVSDRTMRSWVAWYRCGGIAEIVRRRRGGRQGRQSRLNPEQLAALQAKVAEGVFRTIGEAVEWIAENFGQQYTYWGVRSLFDRLRFKKKVPRPLGEKASMETQEAWKKGVWLASLRVSA